MTPVLFFVRMHMVSWMRLAAAPLFTFLILREVIHRQSTVKLHEAHLPHHGQSAVSTLPVPTEESIAEEESSLACSLSDRTAFFIDGPAFYDEGYERDEEGGDAGDDVEIGIDHLFPFKKPGHN